jgi:hypothetical protein
LSGVARSIPEPTETLPDRPKADCLLCLRHDDSGSIRVRVAWYREPLFDPDGLSLTIVSIPRCLDVDACKARVLAAGKTWPLLERGEHNR